MKQVSISARTFARGNGTLVLWSWERGEARIGAHKVRFTPAQADIFDVLMKYRGRVASYESLEKIFPITSEVDDIHGLLRVQMHHIRRRLKQAGVTELEVVSVWGRGYMLCETDPVQLEREAINASNVYVVPQGRVEA